MPLSVNALRVVSVEGGAARVTVTGVCLSGRVVLGSDLDGYDVAAHTKGDHAVRVGHTSELDDVACT